MTTQQQARQPQPRAGTRADGVLARGVLAMRDWLVAAVRRFPLLADAVLGVVLLVLSLPPLTDLRGSNHLLSAVLVVVIVVPLAWRRRAPLVICLLVTVLAVVQWFTVRELTVNVAVLVAFYTVAAHEPARRTLPAGLLLGACAVVAATNWPGVAGAHAVWGWAVASGLIAAAGFAGYYVRTARHARLLAIAERARQAEREREQQAQLAVAAERGRIARELHDIVAHNIAMMIALSDGAAATAAHNPGQAAELMGDIAATGRAALTEMRRLLGVLRQPAAAGHAPQPSLADLDDLLAGVRSAGLPTRLTVTGQPFSVPASAQLALYRLVQEALTNSLKHAPGSSAMVHVSYRPGEIELEVTNDGSAATVSGTGHGIVGMGERAAVFGGVVTAGPRPGGGWRVHTILRPGAGATVSDDPASEEGA